jgi:Fe-S oxidoreductase
VARPERHEGRRDLPLFLPSCAHLGTPEEAARLERGLDALSALGLPVATPGGAAHTGCGFHEWEVGLPEAAAESWERFEGPGRGHPVCVTDCAPSLWAVQDAAPGATGSVDHLVEWLHEHLDDLPAGDGALRVAVHDACFESRRLGLGEAVRAVVRRLTGAEPLALYEAGDEARCCGAAGRWASSFPEAAAHAAESVVADVADAHVDLLVTPSPHCRGALAAAASALVGPSGAPVEVVDLLGLLTRAAERAR